MNLEKTMKRLSVSTIAQQIGGVIIQGSENLLVNNFAYHIKKVKQCTVYFDLLHEKTAASGYYFKNTLCAVVTDELERFVRCGENVTIIYVKDIDKAYWKLIDAYRVMFTIPVIGVTGTCGKTTTKEMIKHILEEKYKVNATYKSFNAEFRHLGYLLKIDEDTQAAVYEMGVASPGNLKVSCRYFKPQVGVITNIGVDHFK
jgi:UDP-N-acetylmuramoyl-tripeptide--D-alanyl-D-alanine ligase